MGNLQGDCDLSQLAQVPCLHIGRNWIRLRKSVLSLPSLFSMGKKFDLAPLSQRVYVNSRLTPSTPKIVGATSEDPPLIRGANQGEIHSIVVLNSIHHHGS